MNGSPDLRIFSGSAHIQLAQDIAAYLGQPLGDATVTSFPDGESFVKINDNVRDRDVFIVQPTCPPTNHNIMELLIMVYAVRRASAQRPSGRQGPPFQREGGVRLPAAGDLPGRFPVRAVWQVAVLGKRQL
ncbi:MAG: ribose-phosphate pyrophosphokinase-like domain-containing protein, partial [Syntrophales bacterium]